MTQFKEQQETTPMPLALNNDDLTKLYDDDNYTAYTEDLEFMWRWTIYRDNKLVQEGCSLSEDSSRRAVNHVLAFFNISAKKAQTEEANY
ncbi:soluble methane monooxygenase-binding protein MmoD [Methyloprofundus sp.]|uniref:soluble methane monooxygenase-binding protein MmoD n=1 Tax=Methyloprofundus sp. TaxID=2020875 RepID=UPI003D09BE69